MGWPPWRSHRASLHELLVAGDVDFVAGKPLSLWSNVLVLPKFEVGNRLKIDTENKISVSPEAISLRGRRLEGAVFVFAHFPKADFTGAQLSGAIFYGADLRGAKLGCDEVSSRGNCAQIQGASFAFARLQGASLDGAQLQGALFESARLEAASFDGAQLQGASFDPFPNPSHPYPTKLQGAYLVGAQLQGASLNSAQLRGADLKDAQLQGASLNGTQLQDALLSNVFVWKAKPPTAENGAGALIDAIEPQPKYLGLDCDNLIACDWTDKSYAALKSLIEASVPRGLRRDKALERIEPLGSPFNEDKSHTSAWIDFAKGLQRSPEPYPERLVKVLKEIGCAAESAYVIAGITDQLDDRFRDSPNQAAEIATVFLDETNCPGAHGLPEEAKEDLRYFRNEVKSPPNSALP